MITYEDEIGEEIEESSITHCIAIDDKIVRIKDDKLDELFLKKQELEQQQATLISDSITMTALGATFLGTSLGTGAMGVIGFAIAYFTNSSPLTGIVGFGASAVLALAFNKQHDNTLEIVEELNSIKQQLDNASNDYNDLIEHFKEKYTDNKTYDSISYC
ncbi:MAG: hypothetical protein IJ301_04605 [Clostridia bacterium]|nr:hypothetical protein [Clostridia bacterium]